MRTQKPPTQDELGASFSSFLACLAQYGHNSILLILLLVEYGVITQVPSDQVSFVLELPGLKQVNIQSDSSEIIYEVC